MTDWERTLERWTKAGLLDEAAASRIRAFEQENAGSTRWRWPAVVALVFGGLMLAAGVLLFVAAHWETLSPEARFALVVAMVGVFHVFGAMTRTRALATTLHGVGTVSLGAGIYLSGQIFNMDEHWPSAVLLWAIGSGVGWWLLRDWVQFAMFAMLAPFWVTGEWIELFPRIGSDAFRVLLEGLLLLSMTYLGARSRTVDGVNRQVLAWIGGITLLPCAVALSLQAAAWGHDTNGSAGPVGAGYVVAFGVPLALAVAFRGREVWMNAIAASWVLLLGLIGITNNIGLYLWCALGAAGLVAWGVRDGASERVNLGMAGFALTLLFFYFSAVMDKLGRSASLIGLGLLFLAGGWGFEKMRRRFVAQARESA
ncbi:MAG: DUF2157 domain-containing protein [Acidobacteriia bacterium]|nr:DUF2157 domain-containing protein [Terriglobia bacterium]